MDDASAGNHAGPDRDGLCAPEVGDAGDLVEEGAHRLGRGEPARLHTPGETDLHGADTGDDPADVAGSEPAIDKAVKPVRFGQFAAGIFVLDTEEKLAVTAEAKGLGDSRIGSIGADDESRGARVAEVEAALRALCRHERRLVSDDGA